MAPERIDTSRPHPARIYDYLLGGKDNYPVDEAAAEQILVHTPTARTAVRANRLFMQRAVRWLAAEAGIRQFLDIGTGIPTEPNLHQIVQGVAPESRVVYADNDPVVLSHARALLRSTREGRTAYLHADAREPQKILQSPELHETLDLSQPVALSLIALLHFVPDEAGPYDLVRSFVDALPSGSYLVLTHGFSGEEQDRLSEVQTVYRSGGISVQGRSRAEVARFFEGLDLVDPGIVTAHRWRPEPGDPLTDATDAEIMVHAGMARKP
ncbi:SAM-dependent methyltransferase [Streptomyces sp. NPDC058371]|uniref:SAM-dependent methyltransferase n=1 Tax=Streptomyces sp. NPDC058371 TaxID=3346463 RepID=UPI00364687EE